MIKLENINMVYNPGTHAAVHALQGINLTIQEGEFIVLLGANGSGKSTLLNVLAGSVSPDSGNIYIGNENVTGTPEFKRSKWVARVFQNPLAGTASELSILENFRLAAIRTRPKSLKVGTGAEFKKLVKEKISELGLGLENKIEQPIGLLSGGQRQALTLLMAVMDDTQILLLDEPAAALDPKTAQLIMTIADKLINRFRLTAVLVTHNMKDTIHYGSRVIQMKNGEIFRDFSGRDKQELQLNELHDWFE